MKKRKKKDVFTRFRSNEKSIYKTIKTTLKSVLQDDKKPILPVIHDLVFEMNDLVIHTYHFIRLYVLHCYNNQLQLPDINDKFILYCIKTLGIRDTRGIKNQETSLFNTLNEFYNMEYQPLVNHEKTSLKHKSYILPYLATQINTCLSNNIQERFFQHFLRFINKTTKHITEDKNLLYKLKTQILQCDNENKSPFINQLFNQWITIHLSNIIPSNIKKSIHYDVKVRPFEYLKGMLYMNNVLEEQGHKLFQPLPLRTNIIPKHVILDTASVINLFCPQDKKKGELLKAVKANQHDVWNSILNLSKKTFRNKHYQFHYQIQTDGISCSLLFIRKDLKDKKWGSKVPVMEEQQFYNIEDLSKEQLDELSHRTIVGCDPGKRNLVYMMDDKGNKLQYTAPQRKRESKLKTNQRIIMVEKKRNGIIEKETQLSFQNSKSVDYEKFRSYVQEKDKLNKETVDFYKRDTWRKMKFRQYSYGKKSVDNFLNKIKETFGDDLLIGYGNWSRNSQMKHFIPTMNKGLRKLIHKKYDTITINECNTSKKCCECHNDLGYYNNGKKQFRLLTCSGCVRPQVKQTVFRTRDANSAINIKNITKCWIEKQERPACFNISSFTMLQNDNVEKVRPS